MLTYGSKKESRHLKLIYLPTKGKRGQAQMKTKAKELINDSEPPMFSLYFLGVLGTYSELAPASKNARRKEQNELVKKDFCWEKNFSIFYNLKKVKMDTDLKCKNENTPSVHALSNVKFT